MSDGPLKPIGTAPLEEIKNISGTVPWEPITSNRIPFGVVSPPNGFLFVHGSACASLATTSAKGYAYVSHFHVFREDKGRIDVDSYIGSVNPENTLAILKIPSEQNPYHHLKLEDSIIENLSKDAQGTIENILRKLEADVANRSEA